MEKSRHEAIAGHNPVLPLVVCPHTGMPARTTQTDDVLNQLCDVDSLWGPFLPLRPARERAFTNARMLAVCSAFGICHGMCVNAVFALTYYWGGRAAPPVYAAPLFFTLTAFALGQFFLAAWNRRAEQLHRRLAWVEANQRVHPRQ